MEFITIPVETREALGSSHARRLRRAGAVPAVLCGMGKRNLSLTVQRADLERFLRTGSLLVELAMGGQARPAIMRELQSDPVTDDILHVDFVRVDADTPVETEVPVVWKGRAPGESEGGVFLTVRDSVEISARPKDLPREYVYDINGVHLHDTVTVGHLPKLPGVEFLEDAHVVLATCGEPKAEQAEAPEEAEEGAEGAEGAAPADEGEASEDR